MLSLCVNYDISVQKLTVAGLAPSCGGHVHSGEVDVS